jgi:hypothetical protein
MAARGHQDLADQGHLLAAQEDVEGAVDDGHEDLGPRPDELSERLRVEVIAGNRAAPLHRRPVPTAVAHVEVRIEDTKVRPATIEDPGNVVGLGRIAGEQAMFTQDPQVARLRSGFRGRRLERGVEIERLRTVALLAGAEAPQERRDLVLAESRQAEVEARRVLEVGD